MEKPCSAIYYFLAVPVAQSDHHLVLSRFTYSFLFRRQYRGIYKRIHMHEIIKIATVRACVCVSFVSAMHLS